MTERQIADGLRGFILKDVQNMLDDVKEYPMRGYDFKSLLLRISKTTAVIPLRQLIAGGSVYIRDKKYYSREAVFSHVANVVFNALEKL